MYTVGQKSLICQGPGTQGIFVTIGPSVRLGFGEHEEGVKEEWV